ncbi:MAG: FAD:protein FMN transferase [Oligosphaeraceae bacterium]
MNAKRHILTRLIPALVVLLVLGVALYRQRGKAPAPSPQELLQPDMAWGQYEFYTSVFHTDCRLVLFGERYRVHNAYARCSESLFQLHNTLNAFDPQSELSRFHQAPDNTPLPLSPLLWRAFQAARLAYQETQGAFDVTVGPLMDFWRQVAKHPEDPQYQGEALETLCARHKASVGFPLLLWDDTAQTVTKSRPGIRVDFGGLAKGLALDILREILQEHDIQYYYISLGGNTLQVLPPGHPYRDLCGLEDMRPGHAGEERCTLAGTAGQCVATSANTLRPLSPPSSGRPLGHILEPETGRPVAPPYASVTAICADGWRSDAYSTAVFVRGEGLARALLEDQRATGFVLTPADQPPQVLGKVSLQDSAPAAAPLP